jgi:uncharacterized protein YeeX (DUF496 family)
MESIVAFPKTKKQTNLLQTLLDEMNIQFTVEEVETATNVSRQEFHEKINEFIRQVESGEVISISKETQKEFLGL